jgi:hypothetical protein
MIKDIVAIDIRNDGGFLRKVIVFCEYNLEMI